jgi:hypothetical protein
MNNPINKYAAIVLCGAAGLFLYQTVEWSKIDGAVWAFWVQAIGSILAIAGAYHIGDRQAVRALQNRNKSYLAIYAAAMERTALVESIFGKDEQTWQARHVEYDPSLIASVIKAIDALPLPELGSAQAVIAALGIRDQLNWLIKSIEAFRDTPSGLYPRESPMQAVMKAAQFDVRRNNLLKSTRAIQHNYEQIRDATSI